MTMIIRLELLPAISNFDAVRAYYRSADARTFGIPPRVSSLGNRSRNVCETSRNLVRI
jgi:hypothetical protein